MTYLHFYTLVITGRGLSVFDDTKWLFLINLLFNIHILWIYIPEFLLLTSSSFVLDSLHTLWPMMFLFFFVGIPFLTFRD